MKTVIFIRSQFINNQIFIYQIKTQKYFVMLEAISEYDKINWDCLDTN